MIQRLPRGQKRKHQNIGSKHIQSDVEKATTNQPIPTYYFIQLEYGLLQNFSQFPLLNNFAIIKISTCHTNMHACEYSVKKIAVQNYQNHIHKTISQVYEDEPNLVTNMTNYISSDQLLYIQVFLVYIVLQFNEYDT